MARASASISGVLAAIGLAAAGACTSGPGPVDDPAYPQRIIADRAAKDEWLRTSTDSPIPAADRSRDLPLPYFPVDPAYRVPAFLTPETQTPPVIIELQTSSDERDRMRRVGTLGFTIGAASYQLAAFAGLDDADLKRLFVPFGDLTNGSATYRGGRFLDLDRTPTGLYDLDFNRAYHPYCVYNHAWICPVPPRENRLPVAIRAGEKLGDAGARQFVP